MVEYIKNQGECLGLAELAGRIIALERQQARKHKILAAFVFTSGYITWREIVGVRRTKETLIGRRK